MTSPQDDRQPSGGTTVQMPERTCPSAKAEPGAMLIGMLGGDGVIAPLAKALTIDAGFVERARLQGPPEARFRFAGRCVEGSCAQWTGSSCGVIERVLTAMTTQSVAPMPGVPRCAIRSTCRWYSQRGADACRACSFVVTDQTRCQADT